MDIRPNHTIYINNINDKVKKEGQRAFVHLFPEPGSLGLWVSEPGPLGPWVSGSLGP